MSIRHLLSLMLFSAFMMEAEAQPVVAVTFKGFSAKMLA